MSTTETTNRATVRDLGVLSYTMGFTFWVHRAESIRPVFAAGYFDEVRDLLAPGDGLLITAPDGMRLCRVVRNDPDVMVEGV